MWHAGNVLHSLVKENELLTWREAKAGGKIWQPTVFSAILYLFSRKHSTKKPAGIFRIITIVCLTRINHKTLIVQSVREGVFEFHIAVQDFSRCFRSVSPKHVILSYFQGQVVRPSTLKNNEQSTFESFTYTEVTSYWINDILHEISLLPREMTTAQAIFWDTFSTVTNKVSSAGGQGEETKRRVLSGKAIFKKLFQE